MPDNVVTWVIVAVLLIPYLLYLVKILKNKLAPVKSVQAVVADKHKTEAFSKYQGSGKTKRYVIVFQTEGKRLSFYVSEFSYGGYRLNETGILKYKGDRIIDFN